MNQHLERAKQRKAAAETAVTPDERVALYASQRSEAQALQKQEVTSAPAIPFPNLPSSVPTWADVT